MAFLLERLARTLLPPAMDPHRPPAWQHRPECIVLPPETGVSPAALPTVRIFLGTERGQFRAERVFLWSVLKHRDPGRRYEIHLLRELAGFQRGYWLTGFTNYRFVVPELCEFQGRAIYNDTDQIYLTDPARLFDLEMGTAGFLSINDHDTSVMLLDCARMAPCWSSEAVRRERRKRLEATARNAGLWGHLDAGWNARDSEYDPGRSRLVHFTTLHTQPWRPFPDQYVYHDNPTGSLWPDLEDECNAAGYLPFTASQPSALWPSCLQRLDRHPQGSRLRRILQAEPSPALQPTLVVDDVLEQVPDNDLGWVLERLFRAATNLHLRVREPRIARADRARRSSWFWQQHLELAAARHPATRWDFYRRCGREVQWLAGGPSGPGPLVVLTHRKPGHNNNALAVARALSQRTERPLLEIPIPWTATAFLGRRLLGRCGLPALPAHTRVVVAAGWLPTRVARLAARGPGRDLRLVLLGRKAGAAPEHGGLLIQCHHFDLPPHPRRIRALLPMNAGLTAPASDHSPWQAWLDAPRRVALLVGGDTHAHMLREPARLARDVSAWARGQDARLLVVTSRRTAPAMAGLHAGLGADDLLHTWHPDDPSNPYGLALAHAHAIVVTGESESMLADAVCAQVPLQIWPLEPRSAHPWQKLVRWVTKTASAKSYNERGSIRPQQGLRYLCARLVERSWVLPPRNLEAMHQALIDQGLATAFGQPMVQSERAFAELLPVVERIVAGLSLDTHPNTNAGHKEHFMSTPDLPAFEPAVDLASQGGPA